MSKSMYKEKRAHGTPSYPVGIHYTFVPSHTERVLHYHWHKEFEFFLLTEGHALFQINDQEFEIHPGDCLFINAGSLHTAKSLSSTQPCSFYAIVFDRTLLSSFPNDLIDTKYIQPIVNHSVVFPTLYRDSVLWESKIITLVKEIIQTFLDQPTTYELIIKSKLLELWQSCFEHSKKYSNTRSSQYRMEQLKIVLNYIHNHYSEKITLEDLSKLLYISEGQLCRLFKSCTNITPFAYIKNYRIQCSCSLIQETDKKIAEIATLVGFDNISYFNKTFREIMHCTPLEYKSSLQHNIR